MAALVMVWMEEEPERARAWVERAATMLEGSVLREEMVRLRGPLAIKETIEISDTAARRLREWLLIGAAMPTVAAPKSKRAKKRRRRK